MEMTAAKVRHATRWTDEKVKSLKLPPEKSESRTLVAPGLYVHLRRKTDNSISKHWQYRAQVEWQSSMALAGGLPRRRLGQANAELRLTSRSP